MGELGYFAGDCAQTGFGGNLDPSFELVHGFSEDDIADFIRAARPDLFRRLNGLPLPSNHVYDAETASSTTPGLLGRRQLQLTGYSNLSAVTTVSPRPADHQMLDLQHKRFVQLKILNDYQLILQKLGHASSSLRCEDPRCETLSFPFGTFFVTLSREYRDARYHYCLACLEALFDRNVPPSRACQLDGKLDATSTPKFPYHFPSNSAEAPSLRKKRDEDTNEVVEFELLQRTFSPQPSPPGCVDNRSPELTLNRPRDVLPYAGRYKKQGRTISDYRKRKVSDTANASELPPWKRQRSHKALGLPYKALICFCREPAGKSVLITCASDACMIGTFHLRCLNLDEEVDDDDEVYCMYCAEIHQATEAESLDEVEVETTESDAPSDAKDETATAPRSGIDQKRVHVADRVPYRVVQDDALTLSSSPSFHSVNGPGQVATSKADHTQTDGVVSPEPLTPYPRPTSTASLSGTASKAAKPSNAIPLPPSSNRTTFADLAPFIICELSSHSPFGLSPNEAKVVRDWQRFCPRSILLQSMSGHDASKLRNTSEGGALNAWDQGLGVMDGKGVGPCKLTELLKYV